MNRTLPLIFVLFYHASSIAQKDDSIVTTNTVLHYSIQGEGQSILLLSGGPGISSNQLSQISQQLGKNHKCLLFDQRGTGKSLTNPMDSTTINLNQSMEDINLLLKKQNLKKIAIIGHSWGAMLAMSYAFRYPGNVSMLVLMGPGPLDLSGYELLRDNITSRASKEEKTFMNKVEDSMAHGTVSRESLRTFHKTFLRLLFFDALKVDSLSELIRSTSNNAMQQLMLQDLNRIHYNIKPGISKIEIPILVICGRQDPVGLFSTFTIRELNKKVKIAWIEKSGHFPWVEQPDFFYPVLFDFLR